MEEPRRKKSGLIILIILLLALMAAGAFYFMRPHEYRVAIIPDPAVRQQPKNELVFHYRWPDDLVQETTGVYACVCFKGQQSLSLVSCPDDVAAPFLQCKGSLKVARRDTYQPYRKDRTLSLPEGQAVAIQQLFQQGTQPFEVGLLPDARGVMQIKNIYIDGVTADKFIKHRSKQQP